MKTILSFCSALLLLLSSYTSFAQCSTTGTPSYTSGCTSEYLTSVTASGTGVVSTISYSGSSCAGSYYNYYTTQGITAPTGSTVTFSIDRCSGYAATAYVFVDWNNDGTYQTTESVGSYALATFATSATITFTIPLIGIITNTNLHLRVFLGESSISAPCSAHWGETCDYYLDATCTDPVLSVTPAAPIICGSGSTSLTASGAGSTPTYTWSPATALSATSGVTVTASPAATTTYTITGYGPGVCSATAPVTVTVDPPVVPVITAGSATTFCSGGSVVLTETSGTGSFYQWYNGVTPILGATNNTYTAAPLVTTTYSVTITTADGCSGTTTQTVTILPTPPAIITPAGPATVCSPASVLLNANPGIGYTYRWFNTVGVISAATNQSYAAAISNTYEVEVTSAAGCKDTSAGITITVNPSPVASATSTSPLNVCAYDSVVLTAGVTAGYSYQWLNGTTAIPGATNITYTADVPGTYNYRLKVTNPFGCSDTTTPGLFPVIVYPIPVSTITASGPLTICAGSSITLSVPSVTGYTYQWFAGPTAATATPLSGATNASYVASATGYYYAVVTSPEGCVSGSQASAVLVTTVAIPDVSFSPPLTFCWGSSVTLSVDIPPAAGLTFQWLRDSVNIPAATGSSFIANLTGSYMCFVNIAGGCMAFTTPVPVNVYPLPNPVITYSGGILMTDTFYTSYQWYHNFSAILGATIYEIVPPDTANYSVIVSDTNGCISQATSYPLHHLSLGVNQITEQGRPVIYPNPATETLYINYAENVRIIIAGADGKVVLTQSSAKEVNVSTLAPGVYFITLYDLQGNWLISDKLIKK